MRHVHVTGKTPAEVREAKRWAIHCRLNGRRTYGNYHGPLRRVAGFRFKDWVRG